MDLRMSILGGIFVLVFIAWARLKCQDKQKIKKDELEFLDTPFSFNTSTFGLLESKNEDSEKQGMIFYLFLKFLNSLFVQSNWI
jgi:hypothetical protein